MTAAPTVVPLPGLLATGGDGTGVDLPPAWRLAPGVRMLWRGDGSFHLEGVRAGVVVTGLDRRVAAGLARPPREASPRGLARRPQSAPDPVDVEALLRLAELGYVRAEGRAPAAPTRAPSGWAHPAETGEPSDPSDSTDATAARVDHAPAAARREARVEVVGVTAVSAYVGSLLACAGVGAVGFGGAGVVRRRHLLPGGLSPADEGRRFAAAAADVVARAAPRCDVGPLLDAEPDLTVVCLEAPVEPELRDLLHRTRRAHLAVRVDATGGEVGPLVVPGVSACLHCADLHRLDHDPAWSVLAVQLIGQAGTAPAPDPGLAARVGVLAADAALAWLDGEPTAAGTLEGSHEVQPARVAPRRRRRWPHPECGCHAAWGS